MKAELEEQESVGGKAKRAKKAPKPRKTSGRTIRRAHDRNMRRVTKLATSVLHDIRAENRRARRQTSRMMRDGFTSITNWLGFRERIRKEGTHVQRDNHEVALGKG